MDSFRSTFIVLGLVGILSSIAATEVANRNKNYRSSNSQDGNTHYVRIVPRPYDEETEGARNERVVLSYLKPALSSSGQAGRLYYLGTCTRRGGEPIPFPRVNVRAPSRGSGGLVAVREIFANDKRAVVAQDSSGVIRINIGKVTDAILRTKIPLVTFEPREQYTAELAVNAITDTKEVTAAVRRLGFDEPVTFYSIGVQEPMKGFPHLPVSVKDATLDEALDLVAKTFGGVVIYRECMTSGGKHLLAVDFIPVSGFKDAPKSEKRSH
jgi:hypothetical protein